MADGDEKEFRINYPGGSLTSALGNLKSLFGEDFDQLDPEPVSTTVSVKGHSRTPVIGKDSISVGSYSYTYNQWPTGSSSTAAAGEVVYMAWDGSGGNWTFRVTGSMHKLADFLQGNVDKVTTFRTERGTPYGPFTSV